MSNKILDPSECADLKSDHGADIPPMASSGCVLSVSYQSPNTLDQEGFEALEYTEVGSEENKQ